MFLFFVVWEKGNVCSILYEHISYSCVKYRVWDVVCTTPMCDRVLHTTADARRFTSDLISSYIALWIKPPYDLSPSFCVIWRSSASSFLKNGFVRASTPQSISEQLKDVLLVSPVKDVTLGYFSILQGLNIKSANEKRVFWKTFRNRKYKYIRAEDFVLQYCKWLCSVILINLISNHLYINFTCISFVVMVNPAPHFT